MSDSNLQTKYGREFAKGEVLMKEGDEGQEMFILQSGKVKVSKIVDGAEKMLATFGPGEFFGEMSILLNAPRSATITAVEDSKVLVIDPKTFESMIKSNVEIAVRIIKKLAARLKEMDVQVENLMLKDKNRKVVHMLVALANEKGQETESGSIALNSSPEALSGNIGLSLEQTEEVLQKLYRAKLVTYEDNKFEIADVGKLLKFLEFLTMKEEFGEFQ